jgi:hypothetical protein
MTRTDICNMALVLIGANQINDYAEASQEGRVCRAFWPNVLDRVIRSHAWNCATYRAELAQVSGFSPAFGWDLAYALPSDPWCLRVLEMQDLTFEFVVQGRLLYTNETTAQIRYVGRPSALGDLDPCLIALLYYQLAVAISFPLMQSNSLRDMLLQEIAAKIEPEAKSADAFEANEPEADHSPWINSRL